MFDPCPPPGKTEPFSTLIFYPKKEMVKRATHPPPLLREFPGDELYVPIDPPTLDYLLLR
jgi:hypothetical protein